MVKMIRQKEILELLAELVEDKRVAEIRLDKTAGGGAEVTATYLFYKNKIEE